MTTHYLKIDPEVFPAVESGVKTHEIRFNDREYHVGDKLFLYVATFPGEEVWNEALFTGRSLRRTVSHIQEGYGLQPGWVVLSFELIDADNLIDLSEALRKAVVANNPFAKGLVIGLASAARSRI